MRDEIKPFIPPHPLTTPVLFLIYKRPDTTRRVFEAIRQAKPPRLYVAADGPKPEVPGEAARVQQVRNLVLEGVDWDCEVKTLFRDKNLGCKYGVSGGINWFFEHEEEGIILEDDTLPSQSFFWFCQELLEKYKDDERIMSVCGYNLISNYFNNKIDKHYSDYLYSIIGFSWGWATWKQSWRSMNIEMTDWPRIKEIGLTEYWPFNKIRNAIWENCFNNKIDSWFYVWDFYKTINSGLSIVPNANLVENIGFGIDATHTKCCKSDRSKVRKTEITFPIKHNEYIVNDGYYEYIFWKVRKNEKKSKIVIFFSKIIKFVGKK